MDPSPENAATPQPSVSVPATLNPDLAALLTQAVKDVAAALAANPTAAAVGKKPAKGVTSDQQAWLNQIKADLSDFIQGVLG